ncbi:MAG: hypothetical protein M1835_005558 [Candelina submexicana]|nr:MAG: hypothetical protein M1835_005558 [Candelina submexicana]
MARLQLLIQTLVVLFLSTPLITSASVVGPPKSQQWTGRPTYGKCLTALDNFVSRVTTDRGYSLDECIEFRSLRTVPKHPELPSELLIPASHAFIDGDIDGPIDDRRGDASLVSTYAESRHAALFVIETCVNGILPNGPSGGILDITSTSPGEEGIHIGPTVLMNVGTDDDLKHDAKKSKYYKGERLLDGNRCVEGGQIYMAG